ncbi:AI-2E family transporter [Agrococcus carbonis]|uniref:Predicted PurR-regulated permease PerM n=1 Tax=Agrococcus carbonis TaxID=684552 RepID=A0A1H1M1B5_9MICO|nr:AI-2E family transporter [Agrococcus carbonis]SDR79799.1 Predicted PurR-regulated permease PerM [Agrococcus carbonis]
MLLRRSKRDRARVLPVNALAAGEDSVPRGMQIAGAWAWRFVAVAAAAAIVIWLIVVFRIVVIPLLVAALITTAALPVVEALVRARWPRGLAVATTVIGLLVAVVGLGWLAISQIRNEYPTLQARGVEFWDETQAWLMSLPFGIDAADLAGFGDNILGTLRDDISSILSSALSVGSSVGHFVAGALLTLFALIFTLLDGARIWRWIVGVLPRIAQPATDGAARAGWVTLGSFVRVQVLVAFIDAVGIGLGAFILGLFFEGGMPLVIPIAILVFLGSFIPIIGAIVTGAIAVLVALVSFGFWPAVIMLGIVLLVQQIESHVLQPIIMGTAVKVHPLAVVLAVGAGSTIAGIAGAFFAVPVVAFLNNFIKTIATGSWRANPNPTIEDVVA